MLLFGRDAERSLLGGLLDGARQSRSGVLVIRGDVGVGKSALLEDSRERATGMRVLSGSGVESEAQLPFAALHQLVRPILAYVERLPGPQARALRGALGLEAGGSEDRFRVSLAVLTLLAEAAEEHPLVCLVDDAHWLDDASADALVFVARRLEAEAVVMLFAAREAEYRRFEAPGLPELNLGGLPSEAASALLDHHAGVSLPPDVRDRLIEETGGNPLALLELPAVLTPDLLSGVDPLAPLPVGERVESAFLARVRRLPDETQTLLLLAGADDTGELATVLRAAARLGVAAEALDTAEQAGLLRVREPRVEFRHPVVRSAVYHGAPVSARRAAHRALADVLEGEAQADRRAWHRAAASVEPDASVVEELEKAAERARRRTGFAAAAWAFERAAALSGEEPEQTRRLTFAAENAWLAGRAGHAQALLERARRLALEPTQQADIDRYLGLIEMTGGVPADACQLLRRAAAKVAPVDADRALELLNIASVAAVYAGDRDAAVAIAELAGSLVVANAPAVRRTVRLLVGLGAFFEGDFAAAETHLRAATELEGDHEDETVVDQPVALLFAGRAAIFLGDDDAIYRTHHAAAAQARAGGALGLLTQILPRLGYAELCAGRWAAASANATEGLRLARELGQHDLVAYQLVLLALIAAHRGHEDECRSLAAEGRELALTRRFTLVAEIADWAVTLLELGLGRPNDALLHAQKVAATGAVFWAGLDRIEAAVRADVPDTAREWLDGFEAWADNGPGAWARAVALHGRALLANHDQESEHLFEAALRAHAQATRPFEHARTQLAFGEFLRRNRRRTDAREHLHRALDGFETLGADLWAERARAELRASGQTARRRISSTADQLTPQEIQIARFVAQGLSNRDVAAQLFLSPRTVAFHLRNVFRKLGISSRTELAQVHLDAAGQ